MYFYCKITIFNKNINVLRVLVLAYISADLTFSLIHHPSPISASEFSLLPSPPSCSLHEGPLHLLFFLPLHFSPGPSLHSISTKHHFCTAVYPNHLLCTCTLSSLCHISFPHSFTPLNTICNYFVC